jgi:hypothetical protein
VEKLKAACEAPQETIKPMTQKYSVLNVATQEVEMTFASKSTAEVYASLFNRSYGCNWFQVVIFGGAS